MYTYKAIYSAAKTNDKGLIYFNKNTPYTNEMLSIIFDRPLNTIEAAFKVLSDFQMIEIDENNFIRICNWDKYQNVESMERVRSLNRNRARNFRSRKKENICADLESASDLNMKISVEPHSDEIGGAAHSNEIGRSSLEFLKEGNLKINNESNFEINGESDLEINIDGISHAKNSNVTVTQQRE
ncbi:phage replisome organizer N-terminal domain-containing protein [Clostridium sp.]|uniref:phage replisome organizer N-terminal domain-containing protein n=1 Tax=Clostridium sp. TaxID=1506 RepID=UPI0028498C68|nr:phage replisome organizer N-terminal domain-containing protein [Clostridium sp.]MDR3594355.1 phage replisome organizer N-terminal domain-containing protein [Clostridium sp.]